MEETTPDEAAALLRVAEQQLDQWKAECRALEARLRAQQPVIDAAEAWETRPSDDQTSEEALFNALDAYRVALSGSVVAGTPAVDDLQRVATIARRLHALLRNGKDMWMDADAEQRRYYELVTRKLLAEIAVMASAPTAEPAPDTAQET